MNLEQLRQSLLFDGWRIGADHMHERGVQWYAWQTLDGGADCLCNDRAPSLRVMPWQHQHCASAEIIVSGEVEGGLWIEFKAYAIPAEEVIRRLPHASAVLLAAWNAAAGVKLSG